MSKRFFFGPAASDENGESRRTRRISTTAIVLLVSIAVSVLLLSVLWFKWLPWHIRAAYGLASVAREMSEARSVHFTGRFIDSNFGLHRVEGWMRGPSRFRIRIEGISDEAADGRRLIRQKMSGGSTLVRVRRPEEVGWELSPGMFRNPQILRYVLKSTDAKLWTPIGTTVIDGSRCREYQIRVPTASALVYADPAGRISSYRQFSETQGPVMTIDDFRYGVRFPDSVFKPAVPKNALVDDPEKLGC